MPVPHVIVTDIHKGKHIFFFLLLLLIISLNGLHAQYQPGLAAKFGVDGDIKSEERLNGTFTAAGSHDWFQKTASGFGIFNTEGAATIAPQIAAGQNYSFSKRMQYDPYSIQDGIMMLDGTYARDYFGLGATVATSDKTVFVAGSTQSNRSYADPTTWTTVPAGGFVPSKSDIIDAYIHTRRNGTSIATGSSSDLYVYFAASTLSTGGDHYIDFELFKDAVNYDQSSGKFSSAGPAATGGRYIWEFNADGTVKTFGSITFSFSFSSSNVSDISIYIWVPYATYTSLNPATFDFASGEFYGPVVNGGYGYAKIKPNGSATLQAWGTVNSAATAAPAWGTNSKELGAIGTNYATTQYSAGQFAEAAINLTSLGVDPALSASYDKCNPLFRRTMIKSRSSSSFASALQDFAGPYQVFYEPAVPANIAPAANLTCTMPTTTLTPVTKMEGASYTWTTTNGTIVSGANTANPLISKAGLYTLTITVLDGCFPNQSTVTVLEDMYKPIASATQIGELTTAVSSTVGLQGGDIAASNYATPFGVSQGLLWNWSGPDGFTSILQNATTQLEGDYQLQVTEKRNGCTAIATLSVVRMNESILPVRLISFTGSILNEKVILNWRVDDNQTGDHFIVQKSIDGLVYAAAATVFNAETTGVETYFYKEAMITAKVFYRLLMVNKDGSTKYSNVVTLQKQVEAKQQLQLLQNPVVNALRFQVQLAHGGTYEASVYSLKGSKVMRVKLSLIKGSNFVSLPFYQAVGNGSYILDLSGLQERHSILFIKQ
jgi:hypothetical protein